MTDESDSAKRGYGHPPREHQFKKGQSGNPKGRPKGAKNKLPRNGRDKIFEIVRKEAYRKVKVTEGEERVTVPMIQATMRSLAVKAAKGTISAQRLFLETAVAAETHFDQRHTALVEAVVHYKFGWQELFKKYDAAGQPRPDVLPCPDDLYVDPQTGEVLLLGPITKEQRDTEIENLRLACKSEISAFKKEIAELKNYLSKTESVDDNRIVEQDIDRAKSAIAKFRGILRKLKGRCRIRRLLVPDSTGNPFKIEQY